MNFKRCTLIGVMKIIIVRPVCRHCMKNEDLGASGVGAWFFAMLSRFDVNFTEKVIFSVPILLIFLVIIFW